MRKILVLVLVAAATLFVSCKNTTTSAVNVAQFEKLQAQDNVQVIDVRTYGEFKSGHLKDAINIDINDASFKDKLSDLDKEKPLLVYCKSGGRSARAAAIATEMGFKVTDLDGGITAWKSEDKPIVEE